MIKMMQEQDPEDEYRPPASYLPQQQDMLGAHETSLKFQLDSEEIIEELKEILLGKKPEFDSKTQTVKYVEGAGLKLLNEKGINSIMVILRGRLNKIFILSDLEDEQIFSITKDVVENLKNAISLNILEGNSWEIRDLTAGSMILSLTGDTVFATLRKAYLRGYQNFLKTVQRFTEIQSYKGDMGHTFQPPGSPPQKEGLMKRIPIVKGFFK